MSIKQACFASPFCLTAQAPRPSTCALSCQQVSVRMCNDLALAQLNKMATPNLLVEIGIYFSLNKRIITRYESAASIIAPNELYHGFKIEVQYIEYSIPPHYNY